MNQSVDKKQRPKGQKSKNLTRGSRGLPAQKGRAFQRQDWMDACSDQKRRKFFWIMQTGLSSVYIISDLSELERSP